MKRPGADARRHGQCLARRQRRRIAADPLGEQRREPQLLEHVEIVVRGRAVGADPDRGADLEHLHDRRDARPEFEVARRIVRDAGARLAQRTDLSFVHVDAVRREDPRFEEALLLHPRHDRHAVLAPGRIHFERRLGQVRVERHVELGGELRAGAEDLGRAGVRRVRRDGGDDQLVPAPSRDEITRAIERVLVAEGVGRRKFQHRLRAQRPQSGRRRRFGHRLFEVVHVREAGGPRADHLRAGEPRAERDELRPHELALHRHHVAHQPDVKAQVICQAAQECHRHMGVGVDQTGHEDFAIAIDYLFCTRSVFLFDFFFGSHPDDAVPLNRDRTTVILAKVLIHGEDEGVDEKRVNLLRHSYSFDDSVGRAFSPTIKDQ